MKEKTTFFINQVIRGKSSMKPQEFLKLTKNIEKEIGRKTKGDYSSRVIDIDILLCESTIINTKNLQIPHKQILLRRFVLVPLSEISPNLILPETKITVKKALSLLKDEYTVKKIQNL